jgi:hypothetical protein
MYYELNSLQDAFKENQNLQFLFFWSHKPSRDGSITKTCLSQWWKCSFIIEEGTEYNSTEQLMMAEKARVFKDEICINKILLSDSPYVIKKLGSEIQNFNQKIWDDLKFEVLVKGNYYKFKQNKSLQQFLLSTNDIIIVQASPLDKIWGIGLDENNPLTLNPNIWKGENLLGFALMKVRDQIR